MPRKLFLHIGFDKTGTTSIQEFIAAHQSDLPDILFPSLDGTFSPKRNTEFSHHVFAEQFIRRAKSTKVKKKSRLRLLRKTWKGLTPDEILAGIAQQLNADDNRPAFISSEVFSRKRLNYSKIKSFLEPYDYKIVTVLRRQDEYARSKYSQQIKLQKRVRKDVKIPPLSKFLTWDMFNYSTRLQKWTHAGFDPKRFIILPYEHERMPNGVIPYVFENLGLGLNGLSPTGFSHNQGLRDFEILTLQWYLSKPHISDKEKRIFIRNVLEFGPQIKTLPMARLMSGRMRTHILNTYKTSNQEIVDTFMPGHAGPLFTHSRHNIDKTADMLRPPPDEMRAYFEQVQALSTLAKQSAELKKTS